MVKQAESSTSDPHSLNVWQKVNAIIREIGPIAKKNKNEHFNYNYAGHDQIMEALAPLYDKYGLSIEPPEPIEVQYIEVGETSRGAKKLKTRVKYEFVVRNADKPEEFYVKHVIGEAVDSEDKGHNKASTQADKYLCLRLFRIATPADDPDALHSEKSDDKYAEQFDERTIGQRRLAQFQVNAFFEACSNNGKTAEQIAAYLKEKLHIVQVEEMMRKDFQESLKWANNTADLRQTLQDSLMVARKRQPKNGQPIAKALDHTDSEDQLGA